MNEIGFSWAKKICRQVWKLYIVDYILLLKLGTSKFWDQGLFHVKFNFGFKVLYRVSKIKIFEFKLLLLRNGALETISW